MTEQNKTTETKNTETKQRFKSTEDLQSYVNNTFIPQIMIDREKAFRPNDSEINIRLTCWLREMSFKGKLNGVSYMTEITKKDVTLLQAINTAWIYKKRELSTDTKAKRAVDKIAKIKEQFGLTDEQIIALLNK